MILPNEPDLESQLADAATEAPPRPASAGLLDLGAALADALAAVEALAGDAGAPGDPATAGRRGGTAEPTARTIDPSTIRGIPARGSSAAFTPAGLPAMPRAPDRPATELAQAQADLAVTRKRYQKLSDEAEELRGRLQRAELDLPQQGARQVLHAVLPALDHLDAMLAHFETQEDLSSHGREALSMLRTEWQKTFSVLQIQPFDALGQAFDPVVHEVIAQVADATQPAGRVIRQVARGYLHGGRLLRSARVVVVAAAPTPEAE